VASAGPYASLHSLQTDNHASTPPLSFFTGRMPFLPPNQQRQSTVPLWTCVIKIDFLTFDAVAILPEFVLSLIVTLLLRLSQKTFLFSRPGLSLFLPGPSAYEVTTLWCCANNVYYHCYYCMALVVCCIAGVVDD